jgi:flagellar biosynthesis/type III secretory pathway chaperone
LKNPTSTKADPDEREKMLSVPTDLPDAFLESTCEVIEELIQEAQDLLTLLVHEHSALKRRRNTDLFEIAKQKHTRLRALESKFQQKIDAVEYLQAEVKKHRARGCLLNMRSAAFLTLWEALRGVLYRCRDQNSANGELIAALGCHTRGVLSLMQGALAESEVYDGSGRRCSNELSSYSNTA